MKIFLDENFPLVLSKTLNTEGYLCEHVITESMRGCSDREIVRHLTSEKYIFFTHDDDFLELLTESDTVLFLSKIPQSQSFEQRLDVWTQAVKTYIDNYQKSDENVFEVHLDKGLSPIDH